MNGRNLLITGATGGLGMALVQEALARGHRVRATGRSHAEGKQLAQLGAEFVAFDLACADPAPLVAGCHSVIHAAALAATWGKLTDFYRINVSATQDLLQACREACVERFVFVSSPSIYAGFSDRTGIDSDCPATSPPLNNYALTKLAAERLLLADSQTAMACCTIRPRALVGEGDRVILPHLAALARRRRVVLPRGGRAFIELTDLRDAAWAVCEAEERALSLQGAAINISGGKPIPVKVLAQRLTRVLGYNPQWVSLPILPAHLLANLLEGGARLFGSIREPLLTRYTLATLAYSQTFDLGPARRLLGYEPRHDAVQSLLEQARLLARKEVAK